MESHLFGWGWVEASPFGWDLRDSGVHFDYYSPELSTLLVLSYLILLAILYFHFMMKILRFKKAKEIAQGHRSRKWMHQDLFEVNLNTLCPAHLPAHCPAQQVSSREKQAGGGEWRVLKQWVKVSPWLTIKSPVPLVSPAAAEQYWVIKKGWPKKFFFEPPRYRMVLAWAFQGWIRTQQICLSPSLHL